MEAAGPGFALLMHEAIAVARDKRRYTMELLAQSFELAAAGWAFLVWLFGGGLGLALVVFVVLKMFGK
jgi:hypothetical protein